MPDYTKMEDSEAYTSCGIDARKWADYFVQCTQHCPEIATDIDVMQTWFSNTMMAMHDRVLKEIDNA